MSSNREILHRCHPTHKQQQSETILNKARLSRKRPPVSPSILFSQANSNSHNESVYGFGDVPRTEAAFIKQTSETTKENRKFFKPSRRKKTTSGPICQLKSTTSNTEDEKTDKRQRLLDWLKASQAKRDENNRQVFSRWIEKMDSMKAQVREQSTCPTFYCDYLPLPHVLYSAISNCQEEAIGTPTVYLGVPQFMYHPQTELIDPQLMHNAECFLKMSDQLVDVGPASEYEYGFPDNPGLLSNHDFYAQTQGESTQEALIEKADLTSSCAENAMQYGAPGASIVPASMNYTTTAPIVFPIPCMHYFNQSAEEPNIVVPSGDGIDNSATSILGPKPPSSPILFQTDFRQMAQAPPSCSFVNRSKHPVANTLYSPNEGFNASPSMRDLTFVYNHANPALNFDMIHWNSLLDDISNKMSALPQDVGKQAIFQEMLLSELSTGLKGGVHEGK
ncbi:unnamed protein product [Hydatigera taeniaeformis]|uniref:Expressed conserved protein n=1 Tax=Hydatigena taeniaeformis TaxID=6205 RepID=A0A0R3WS97_HYDTA|nr:unnamed protein product [Hydatigera taeniaeformis]